ncbi:hypothetical protein F4811DRAFT_567883 [Daldinia bambusicola]|nr:hypothetical protein F4811DRAFT_567883 [Daldinia bambusicola]
MTPITPCHPAITGAESIAALHFLHPIPVQPLSNPVTDVQQRAVNYTLPFEKERILCSTLAFLAHVKDDSNNIPAVCLEEGVDGAYLNVLLAINQHKYEGGSLILEGLEREFKTIFSLLAHVDDGSSDIENDVFRAIISMCSERILYRLGLIQGRRKNSRRSIQKDLEVALEYFRWSTAYKNKSSSNLTLFISRAKEVIRLVDSWRKHQKQHELEQLVDGVRHLRGVENACVLISSIPNQPDMGPSSRDHLINTIGKVARYREAARSLYRMAKKIPLIRNMRLMPVRLSSEAFNRNFGIDAVPDLEATISLVDGASKKINLDRVCNLLRIGKYQADRQFTQQVRKTLQEARIHAEIQLLYYCEFYRPPNTHLPRVVCSSKDACWLCNEFILMYEKIHTPRCHGKIYPGWRLPAQSGHENHDLATRYNTRLRGHISIGLKTLFGRGKKTVYPDSNESTLLSLEWSRSTLQIVAPSSPDAPEAPSMSDKDPEEAVLPAEASVHESEAVGKGKGKEIATEMDGRTSDASLVHTGKSTEQLDEISVAETSDRTRSGLTLELGHTKSRDIRMGNTSSLYKAGPLEIQIEYAESSSPESQGGRRKKLAYTMELLSPEEVKELRRGRQKNPIVDAELLEGDVEHNTDREGCVYIANGDAVVKIIMQPVVVE